MSHVALSMLATYVEERISSNAVSLETYVTTDSLLPNKAGREPAQKLPPNRVSLTKFEPGDVLVANIRPYLKKIWQADCTGGCSPDVLVFRVRPHHSPDFLYSVLIQDAFFDHAMTGKKGAKMPRGDKQQIMRFLVPDLSEEEEHHIGQLNAALSSKIRLNRQLNDNL
ncbi:MAG: restriction endonuclease subunit S, partial [Bacteroidales bacterium]|nr:restriction endonuclease subunit S [Candidatus Colimorpha merdihippi]